MSAIETTAPRLGPAPRPPTPLLADPDEPAPSRRWLVVAFGVLALIFGAMLAVAETGPGALRDPNPIGTHWVNGNPRANAPFLGFDYWPQLWQAVGFGGAAILLGVFGWRSWRSRKLENGLLVTFAAGGMYFFDPFYNWLGYFPTDPRFLHIPHGTIPFWSDLAPTFEPVFFFPLYMVWLVYPALLTHWIWGRLRNRAQRRKGPDTWMQRHPLISLLIVCKCVTFTLDLAGFRAGTVTEAFIFSQAPGPLISGGDTSQAQLLWEPLLFELTMMATCLLFYRDAEGRTPQRRLARKLRTFARFPRFTEFAAAWSIIALAYVVCLVGMGTLRFTGQTDKLAQPWPYEDTQVYDPDGLYRQAGAPGLKRTGDGNWNGTRPTWDGTRP
ncbi:spirocyclase AveC family protein [Patulibacter defluvii]|uniref:spirocyclase AveC family protein n=1 Tax=Patulibacter defluvii TaxID=3095358 RepID=UPI002A74D0BD|nr:spirocyclase AveC family protein [Patulibacter sp. DM4]